MVARRQEILFASNREPNQMIFSITEFSLKVADNTFAA